MKQRNYKFVFLLILCLLCFVSFINIGKAPIQLWDEARHGISAYEMIQTGEYVVTTFDYEPDYWNLKPPLSEYFIVLGYKLFGYNGIGMRSFSGLLWIVIALGYSFYACRRYGKLSSLLVLYLFTTVYRVFKGHGVRTGDADALFIFFSAYSMLFLLKYDQSTQSKFLYEACICFALGFLTKSWHAGLIALLILIYLIIYDRKAFRNWKKLAACFACAILPILLWGWYRYQKDGTIFFEKMIQIDLLKRTSEVLEGHVGSILYYVVRIGGDMAALGMCLIIFLYVCLRRKTFFQQRDSMIAMLYCVLPVALFSVVKTKCSWYIFMIYPAMILLSGKAIVEVLEQSKMWKRNTRFLCLSIPAILVTFGLGINIYLGVTPPVNDLEQDLRATVSREAEISGRSIYKGTRSDWAQNEILALEWAGDFKAKYGGGGKWSEDPSALLLLKNDQVESVSEQFSVAVQGEHYSIIQHK